MKRRDFIAGLGVAAVPVGVRAQRAAVPVIGWLGSQSRQAAGAREFLVAFRRGLSETGYVEGRNVAFEYRWAESHNDRLPALAAELVRRGVTVIVAPSTPSALAGKAATPTIPIVFEIGGDPVEIGLVASLNRPGGNVTGVAQLSAEVVAKRLELLHEVVPAATLVGLLVNPTNPQFAEPQKREVERAARLLGLQLLVLNARDLSEVEAAFATLAPKRVDALLVTAEPLFLNLPREIAALAARHSVPAIYEFRGFAEAGGLMSYGTHIPDAFYLVGTYAGRILNGEKPADLPVQQATKIDLVINLKTAKALGLVVPRSILARADDVIE